MKITEVRAKRYAFEGAVPKEIGIGQETVVVTIATDDGITGLGTQPLIISHAGPIGDAMCQLIERNLARLIQGEDPRQVEMLWDRMYKMAPNSSGWGRRGIILQAIAAVDIALWDLAAKKAGLPLWKLLGGYRDKIPVYASVQADMSNDKLAELTQTLVRKGYLGIKVRCGVGVIPLELVPERVRMVREAIGPDTRLMIDINGTWDSTTAIQMCRKLEPYNLFWIEEPLFPDDLEGFVRLKNSTRTFIATGEQMGTRFEFRDLIQRHGVDVLQPDAARVGGITEWVKIRGMASCFGYPMAPHGMLGIHFAAAFPEVLWCEMAQLGDSYTRLGQRLLKTARQPHEPDHGYVPAFTAPGIGVELNEEVLTAAR